MNDSFVTIAEQMRTADTILLFTHINMDGDALGSSVALCRALRDLGKTCYILLEDEISDNLKFLDKDYCTWDPEIMKDPDLCVCLDCGEEGRFPKRAEKFREGKVKICIDHHRTSDPICDYNHIDPEASATGELVYKLIRCLDVPIDKEIGEALFAAITTDTGNFQYTNTTAETHRIAAELYDAGIDGNYVSIQIYERIRIERLRLTTRILDTLQLFGDGKVAITYVNQEMLDETGASMDEAEGIVATLRSIDGVQISAILKEKNPGEIKVSMRAKEQGDVAMIAKEFAGGGHKKAAGFTLHCSMEEAVTLVSEKAMENLANGY